MYSWVLLSSSAANGITLGLLKHFDILAMPVYCTGLLLHAEDWHQSHHFAGWRDTNCFTCHSFTHCQLQAKF